MEVRLRTLEYAEKGRQANDSVVSARMTLLEDFKLDEEGRAEAVQQRIDQFNANLTRMEVRLRTLEYAEKGRQANDSVVSARMTLLEDFKLDEEGRAEAIQQRIDQLHADLMAIRNQTSNTSASPSSLGNSSSTTTDAIAADLFQLQSRFSLLESTLSQWQYPANVISSISSCLHMDCGHGYCSLGKCVCPEGEYRGDRCEIPICSQGCANGGECRMPNQCVCPAQYGGIDCTVTVTAKLRLVTSAPNSLQPDDIASPCQGAVEVQDPSSLQYGGVCSSDMTLETASVICRQLGYTEGAATLVFDDRFFAPSSSLHDERQPPSYVITDSPSCNGSESSLLECTVPPAFGTPRCASPDQVVSVVCSPCTVSPSSPQAACKNGGRSTGPSSCSCPPLYTGPTCSTPVCPQGCGDHGTCMGAGMCSCDDGYFGVDCSISVETVADADPVAVSALGLASLPSSPFYLMPPPLELEVRHAYPVCEGVPYRSSQNGSVPVLPSLSSEGDTDTAIMLSICISLFGPLQNATYVRYVQGRGDGQMLVTSADGGTSRFVPTTTPLPLLSCGPCALLEGGQIQSDESEGGQAESSSSPSSLSHPLASLSPNCSLHGTLLDSGVCSCHSDWSGAVCDSPRMSAMCPSGSTPIFPDVCVCIGGQVVTVGVNAHMGGSSCSSPFPSPWLYIPRYVVGGFPLLFGVLETVNPFTLTRAIVLEGSSAACSSLSYLATSSMQVLSGRLGGISTSGMEWISTPPLTYDSVSLDNFSSASAFYHPALCANESAHIATSDALPLTHLCSQRGSLYKYDNGVVECQCEGMYGGDMCEITLSMSEYVRKLVLRPVRSLPSWTPPSSWLSDDRGGVLSFSSGNPCLLNTLSYSWLGTEYSVVSTDFDYSSTRSAVCSQLGLRVLTSYLTSPVEGAQVLFSCPEGSISVGDCSASSGSLSSDAFVLQVQCACPLGAIVPTAVTMAPTSVTSPDGAKYDYLGRGGAFLSADGLMLVSASHGDDDMGSESGSVLVWERTSRATPFSSVIPVKLLDPSGQSEDYLGVGGASICADGLTLVAASKGDDHGSFSDAGAVLVWERNNGKSPFSAVSPYNLFDPNGDSDDNLGYGVVSISLDGLIIVAGAYRDENRGVNSGSILVWTRSARSVAFQSSASVKLTDPLGSAYDYLGYGGASISADGRIIIAGEYRYDGVAVDSGAVMVWERSNTSAPFGDVQAVKLVHPSGQAKDYLGFGNPSISNDGLTLVAGAHGTGGGAVIVWERPSRGVSFNSKLAFQLGKDVASTYLGQSGATISGNGLVVAAGDHYAYLGGSSDYGAVLVWRRPRREISFENIEPIFLTDPYARNGDYLGHGRIGMSADTLAIAAGAYGKERDTVSDTYSGALLVWEFPVNFSCPPNYAGQECRPCPATCGEGTKCDDGYYGSGECV